MLEIYFFEFQVRSLIVIEYLDEHRAGPSAAPTGTFSVNVIDIALEQNVSFLIISWKGSYWKKFFFAFGVCTVPKVSEVHDSPFYCSNF